MIWDFTTEDERAEVDALGAAYRNAENDKAREDARAALRVRLADMVRALVERIAPEYLEAGAKVARLHADISGAAELLRTLGAGEVVERDHWTLMRVPSANGIAALRNRGEIVHPTWGTRVLAGGEPVTVERALSGAYEDLRLSIERRLGFSPFDAEPRAVHAPAHVNGAAAQEAVR
jgi:hypothetical protein